LISADYTFIGAKQCTYS